jgi:hypothetical protein
MKNTFSGSLVITISRNEIESLTIEVKETLAFEHRVVKAKSFTSADLWNIQGQRKTRSSRRFI